MKKILIISYFLFAVCLLQAQHSFELGSGWGNMGLSPETTWKPYSWSQGSRKEVNVAFTYHYLSEHRVYYAPSASLFYINTWSMTGGLNLAMLNLGLCGLGVYISKTISAFSPEERSKKWFATCEINFASVSLGGNITPNYGSSGKKSGVREWTDPYAQFENGVPNQHYPFKDTYDAIHDGHYVCFQYAIPITFRVWKMITPKIGFGMFIASNIMIFEKSLNFKNTPWAIGYDVRTGFVLTLFNSKKCLAP